MEILKGPLQELSKDHEDEVHRYQDVVMNHFMPVKVVYHSLWSLIFEVKI